MHKRLAVLSAAAILGFSLGGPVAAESMHELKANEKQIQQKRADITKNMSSAEREIASVLAELDDMQNKIEKTEKALGLNKAEVNKTKRQINASKEKVDELNADMDDLEKQTDKRYDILRDRMIAYQQSGGEIAYLDVLAGSQSFSQFASRQKAVAQVSKSDIELVKELEAAESELTNSRKAVTAELAKQEAQQAELEGVGKTIADQKKQLEADEEKLSSKQSELKKRQAELSMKDSELAGLQKQVKSELKQKEEEAAEKAREQAEQKVREARVQAAMEAERLQQEQERNAKATDQMEKTQDFKPVPTLNSDSSNKSNAGKKNDVTKSTISETNTDPSSVMQASGLDKAIEAGYTQIGTPYVWGGKKPGGFDCSGFVSWAYRQAGFNLPSSTAGLQYAGKKISYSGARPGDMVFFNTYKTNGHVGIYLGNDRFLGAQDSGLDVADMSSGYWKNHFTGHVRRIQ